MKKLFVLMSIITLLCSAAWAEPVMTVSNVVTVDEYRNIPQSEKEFKKINSQSVTDSLGNSYTFLIQENSSGPILLVKKSESGKIQWTDTLEPGSHLINLNAKKKEFANLKANKYGVSFTVNSQPKQILSTLDPYYIKGEFKIDANGNLIESMGYFSDYPHVITSDFIVNGQRYFVMRNESMAPFWGASRNVLYRLNGNNLKFVAYLITSKPNVWQKLKIKNSQVIMDFNGQEVIFDSVAQKVKMRNPIANLARKWHNFYWVFIKSDDTSNPHDGENKIIPLKTGDIKVNRSTIISEEAERTINLSLKGDKSASGKLVTDTHFLGNVLQIQKDSKGNKYIIVSAQNHPKTNYIILKVSYSNTLEWIHGLNDDIVNPQFNTENGGVYLSFHKTSKSRKRLYNSNKVFINDNGDIRDNFKVIDSFGGHRIVLFKYKDQEYIIITVAHGVQWDTEFKLYKKDGLNTYEIKKIAERYNSFQTEIVPTIEFFNDGFRIKINNQQMSHRDGDPIPYAQLKVLVEVNGPSFWWDNGLYTPPKGTKVKFK